MHSIGAILSPLHYFPRNPTMSGGDLHPKAVAMSRNDPLNRQWYLIKKLAGSRGATLEELVAALPPEPRCLARTVRRDLEAVEAGYHC